MDTKQHATEFYLDSIDEIFAEFFFRFDGCFNVQMKIAPETSFVSALFLKRELMINREKAIDFELCAFECSGVATAGLEEYVGISIHTSSALEFFDYVFSQTSEVSCNVDFTGNSWIVALAVMG